MAFDQPKAPQEEILDQEKLKKLKSRIFMMERDNYKTKKFKTNEMVDRIMKAIIQEVDNVN